MEFVDCEGRVMPNMVTDLTATRSLKFCTENLYSPNKNLNTWNKLQAQAGLIVYNTSI